MKSIFARETLLLKNRVEVTSNQLVELFILMAQKKHTCLIISQVYYG